MAWTYSISIASKQGLVQTRTYEYVAFHNPRTTTAGIGFIAVQLAYTQYLKTFLHDDCFCARPLCL